MREAKVAEILKKVRKIQILANRRVDDLMTGQYHSVFRGQGIEFDEVREYQPGDDVRTIDWNVTARAGTPFIKRFCEERELTLLFLVDISASGIFGSRDRSKLETIVEVVALLMFSALKNNDKVGVAFFANEVVRYFPPRKGKAHVLRLIRELVTVEPVRRSTNIAAALDFVNKVQKRRGIVFVVSDFLGENSKKSLAAANRRHDVIAVPISDPREIELPDVGFVTLEDAETGERIEVDAGSYEVRQMFAAQAAKRSRSLTDMFRKAGVDELPLSTTSDYVKSLHRFFNMRERRQRV